MKILNILVLVDKETVPDDDPQLEGTDEVLLEQVEFHVAEALRLLGHHVQVLPLHDRPEIATNQITEARPDFIFNLTEHVHGDRKKDMHVAALLELLEIPFTGSGPQGLMLCRDKAICKKLLAHHRVKVPDFTSIPKGKFRIQKTHHFPLIVKPVFEDGSDGISAASLVHNHDELEQRVRMLHDRMNQSVICEEYIQGREIYVAVLGNNRMTALPARELRFGKTGEGGPNFATAKVKRDEAYRKKWKIQYVHANLPEELQAKAANFSKKVCKLLSILDYGRIDMRITPDNELVFLEANPNPDLTRGDEVAESAEKAGIDYVDLIGRILNLALRRYSS